MVKIFYIQNYTPDYGGGDTTHNFITIPECPCNKGLLKTVKIRTWRNLVSKFLSGRELYKSGALNDCDVTWRTAWLNQPTCTELKLEG